MEPDATKTAETTDDSRPTAKMGDWVQAKGEQKEDDGTDVARERDIGEVVDIGHGKPGDLTMIYWHRTGQTFGCFAEEFDILCPEDFASTEDTTPKKPRRVMVKRGVS